MLRTASARTLFALAVLALPLAACSDDDTATTTTAKPTTTTAAETPADFMTRVQEECPGFEPGFDQFLADHPDPTAEDWAGFLPSQLDGFAAQRDCIADSNPPAVLAEKIAAVTAAMDVVAADMQAAIDAADDGDLDGVDSALETMNSGHVEAIDSAVQDVMAAASAG